MAGFSFAHSRSIRRYRSGGGDALPNVCGSSCGHHGLTLVRRRHVDGQTDKVDVPLLSTRIALELRDHHAVEALRCCNSGYRWGELQPLLLRRYVVDI